MRGGGTTSLKDSAKQLHTRSVKATAWVSFGLAAVGGAALAGTPISGLIITVLHWIGAAVSMIPLLHLPAALVPYVALVVAALYAGYDVYCDLEPNWYALYGAILIPTLARATPGKLAATVTDVAHSLVQAVNQTLGPWLGTGSAIVVAALTILISVLMARRVVTKSPGGR